MRLWRISNYDDLKGIGGVATPGRWHHAGNPVVYLAEHPALALLEVMVHFELADDELPDSFQLLEVDVPDTIGIMELPADQLPQGWEKEQQVSRDAGTQWLNSEQSVLLQVPSVLVPGHNYLLNPHHPDASLIKIVQVQSHPLDDRLLP